MAANRTIPITGTGAAFVADVKDEIEQLYKDAFCELNTYAGTANAVTANALPALGAYANGNGVIFKPTADVTGSLTININSLGAKDVVDRHGNAILDGMMKTGGSYPLRYDSAIGKFVAITCERGMVGRQDKYFSVGAGGLEARTTAGAAAGTVETTTNNVMLRTLDFDTTTQEHAQFSFRAPKRWNLGTMTAIFVWSHAAATVNFTVRWGIQGLALSDGDAADTAFGTAVEVQDVGGTTNDIYKTNETAAFTLSNTPAAGDWLVFQVYRDTGDAADTMAIDARLHGVHLFWTSNDNEETV